MEACDLFKNQNMYTKTKEIQNLKAKIAKFWNNITTMIKTNKFGCVNN